MNPKNCQLGVTEGKLFGHIISKKGVRIDPERVVAIDNIHKVSIEMCPWYTNIVYYLQHSKCRDDLNENQKRTTKLQAAKYVLIQGDLY